MDPLGPRRYARSVLRSYIAELRRLGILDEARARASPEILPLLDKAGRAPPWIGPEAIDEVLAVVGGPPRGRAAAREFSHQTMKGGGFPSVMEPLIHLSLSMLGVSPASLFGRAQTMASVVMHGIEMKWTSGGEASGTMRMRCEEPVPELTWAAWEGVLLWAFDLCGTRGTVAPARPSPDRRTCEVDVSWEQKAK
jgi:hypothetical protein